MKIDKIKLIYKVKLTVISLLILTFFINNTYAATVEVTSGKMPDSLQEGKGINFTMTIKNYEGARQLTLETNLVSSTNKPLWNFGDSEQMIDVNRYQQEVTLNLSSLPSALNVAVSGKVPDGVDIVKCNDVVLNKMHDTQLKYYEIHADNSLVGIGSFELIINAKEQFENTLKNIRRSEFDSMKKDVSKIFYIGVTTEAQNLATEMSNIVWPDSLTLFTVLPIKSNMILNILVIVIGIVMYIAGYVIGSRDDEEEI